MILAVFSHPSKQCRFIPLRIFVGCIFVLLMSLLQNRKIFFFIIRYHSVRHSIKALFYQSLIVLIHSTQKEGHFL